MSWDLHRTPKPFLRRELIAFMQLAGVCDEWMPTTEQLRELSSYCSLGYEVLNNRLRGVDAFFDRWWDSERQERFARIDERIRVMASIEPVLAPAPLALWRGVRIPAGCGPVAGQPWIEKGFCSASISRARAEKAVNGYRDLDRDGIQYERWLMRIDIAAGQPIIPVYWAMLNEPGHSPARMSSRDPQPYHVNEAEIMLSPGAALHASLIARRTDGVNVMRCTFDPAQLAAGSMAA